MTLSKAQIIMRASEVIFTEIQRMVEERICNEMSITTWNKVSWDVGMDAARIIRRGVQMNIPSFIKLYIANESN